MTTSIEWTDETVNFLIVRSEKTGKTGWACRKIGPDCLNCYAETMNLRNGANPARRGTGQVYAASGFAEVEPLFDRKKLRSLLRWKKPRRVFPNDMTDMFLCVKACRACGSTWEDLYDRDEACRSCKSSDLKVFWPSEWITEALSVYAERGARGFAVQVLTKRPDRLVVELSTWQVRQSGGDRELEVLPRGVWIGVSAGNQEVLEDRIRKPAMILRRLSLGPLWLSAEPLVGPMELAPVRKHVDWIVVGGESGPGARPCRVEWIESICAQGRQYGIPVFVKQLGSHCIHQGRRLKLRHPKGGDPSEWPEHLRIREPNARVPKWQG